MCVLHFNVVFLLCRSYPLILDVFPSVLPCNPDLAFFSQSIYEFEQRCTTVAFIDIHFLLDQINFFQSCVLILVCS